METTNKYNRFLDDILSKQDIPNDQKELIKSEALPELDKIERGNNWARAIFAFFVLVLFGFSFAATFFTMYQVEKIEVDLISRELLQASDRSINGTIIAALIAATVTQTGLAFYAVTKYLFSGD